MVKLSSFSSQGCRLNVQRTLTSDLCFGRTTPIDQRRHSCPVVLICQQDVLLSKLFLLKKWDFYRRNIQIWRRRTCRLLGMSSASQWSTSQVHEHGQALSDTPHSSLTFPEAGNESSAPHFCRQWWRTCTSPRGPPSPALSAAHSRMQSSGVETLWSSAWSFLSLIWIAIPAFFLDIPKCPEPCNLMPLLVAILDFWINLNLK